MREHITPILGALAIVALYAAGSGLDEIDAAQATANSLLDAQQVAAIDETEMKAARRCNEAHPGGAALVWSHRGEAVCVPRPLP